MAARRTTGSINSANGVAELETKFDPVAVKHGIDHSPGDELEFSHNLHRGLKARHITMIAIGGAIGTGLIIGT